MRSASATNGQAICCIDVATGAEGDVAGYPSPDALWKLTYADAGRATATRLDAEKLSAPLQLRYQALNDAFAELGRPDPVRRVFVGFQRHLYAGGPASGASHAS